MFLRNHLNILIRLMDLVLFELIDIERNTLGNAKKVHKHYERVDKKGYVIHSKNHIVDKECKIIKKRLRK